MHDLAPFFTVNRVHGQVAALNLVVVFFFVLLQGQSTPASSCHALDTVW